MGLSAMLHKLDARFSSKPREVIEVHEHEPPRELVAAKDITRTDTLGRTVVAVPAGMPPAHWVNLTKAERAALVPPKPRPPTGYPHPGAGGFTPEGVRLGFTIEPGGTW
jgi:hypothetical protein